ncbi:MAG: hypothetical protein ACMG6E_07130 [Candidatus Roizmanbacteria bacterium]
MKTSDEQSNITMTTAKEVPSYIPLSSVTDPSKWIKVPLLTTLRYARQQSNYGGYSHNSYNKFVSKEYIPRLLWLNLDWTLAQIHQHIFFLYAFVLESDAEQDHQLYKDHYEKMLEAIEKNEEMSDSWLDMDSTQFPFLLNVVNPHKSRNYFNPCRVCKLKNCNNCHLPVGKSITLRQFLAETAHSTKFNSNDNLFRNADDLREEENNEKPEQEESKGWTSLGFQNGNSNPAWNSSSINADNDDDNDAGFKK